jgi:hypothetical protein
VSKTEATIVQRKDVVMRESALVTYNQKVIDYSTGTAGSVEFNFDRIWAFKAKTSPFHPGALHFYHVHPPGVLCYSETDVNCMQGFNIAFDSHICFSIIVFKNSDLMSIYHEMKSYYYYQGITHEHMYLEIPSDELLLFLKHLSYGEQK